MSKLQFEHDILNKIFDGKEISKDSQERWVHKHCAEDTLDLP